MHLFYSILGNVIVAQVTNTFAWFALVFWAYLETGSVVATSLIGGSFLAATALFGVFFGAYVDHHKKKNAFVLSGTLSLCLYSLATAVFFLVYDGSAQILDPAFLAIIFLIVLGSVAGNMRMIAVSTMVTLAVPEHMRAKANGAVGAANGVAFALSSVISGLLVGWYGMHVVLLAAVICTLLPLLHILLLKFPHEHIEHTEENPKAMDLRGTLAAILAVPGFIMLIFFTTFNNFLGGVFMALMDAYGLSMVSVEAWGIILGVLSPAFIIGGLLIAKFGLGNNPLRLLLLVNVVMWIVCIFFTIQPLLWLLIVGMLLWMILSPVIEATEHTVIQKVIPYERQGRVFGFAQTVEQTASPVTAFLIGPVTQYFFIPFMTTGMGVVWIGSWFGSGPARGIALVFIVAGILGLLMTLYAFNSRAYRLLSARYRQSEEAVSPS